MSSHGCVQSNVYTAAVTYIHLATLSDWKYTLQASEVKTFPARLSCRSLLCLLFIFRPHLCPPVLCASNPPDWGEDIGLSMSWRSTFGQMREEEIVPNGWSQVGPLWSKRWLGGRNTEETSRPKENIKQQTGVTYLWFMDWQMLEDHFNSNMRRPWYETKTWSCRVKNNFHFLKIVGWVKQWQLLLSGPIKEFPRSARS